MTAPFELLLFASDAHRVAHAAAAGLDALVVDLERRGKAGRQQGRDTQISTHEVGDIAWVRQASPLPVICRINPPGPDTTDEVQAVLAAGVDEVLVPMVRHARELDVVIAAVAGRAGVACMVETRDAIDGVELLMSRPLSRVYVGLNDLAIDDGRDELFTPLVDGTVARVIDAAGGTPVGVAGLTLPEAGAPVPCHHIVAELARLGASFTFLRRSFIRDVAVVDMAPAVARIRSAMAAARQRPPAVVAADHAATREVLRALAPA